jgi:hypothetical protein
MLGLSTSAFTELHVLISLVGILSGLIMLGAMLRGRMPPVWTGIFLVTTILTSATGFLFQSAAIGPPHMVGAISLVILAVACFAWYGRGLRGPWRRVYVVAALLALYLNVFVGVVQAFGKVPALKALAPTQTEAPFLLAQAATLLLFAGSAFVAATRATAPPGASAHGAAIDRR